MINKLYQRSADAFLGVPFNIASYALLTHMIAQQTNLDVGEFIWTGGDCHIYSNHIDGLKELLTRNPNTYPLPTIETKNFTSIFDWKAEDTQVLNYQSFPRIAFEIAV